MSGSGFIELRDKETNARHAVPLGSIQSVDEEEDGGVFVALATFENNMSCGIKTAESYDQIKMKLYEAKG